MRHTLLGAIALFILPLTAQAAEVCAQVHDLANEWHNLAHLVHETQGEGFNPGEVHDIADTIGEMDAGTRSIATLLLEHGNDTQITLGQQLEAVMNEFAQLSGAPKAEHAVRVMDQIVASIDVVTHDCDAGGAPAL